MRQSVLRLLATIPLVLGLAACSGGSSGNGGDSGGGSGNGQQVPAGVAEQYATLEKEIKAEGGETKVGEWRITYIVEPAEPWFAAEGGRQVFRESAARETHHIEIIPFEAKTGRVVPNVPIRLEVVDAAGKVVDAKPLNFYYGEFYHYANNFSVPQAGNYTLKATLQPPTFLRHGEKGETPALAEGATATFTGVGLKPEK